jgi:hypothetical protein
MGKISEDENTSKEGLRDPSWNAILYGLERYASKVSTAKFLFSFAKVQFEFNI